MVRTDGISSAAVRWLGAGTALVALVVCYPTVRGNFACDDFRLLIRLVDQDLGRALFAPFNGHVMPLSIGAMGALFRAVGFVPWPYFALLLGFHVANAWLLYQLTQRITRSPLIAAAAACFWSTGPAAIQTLSWFNNLGPVLMTTIMLVVLGGIARTTERSAAIGVRTALLWGGLLLLGANTTAPGLAMLCATSFALALYPADLGITRGARAILLLTPCIGVSAFVVSSTWWPDAAHTTQSLGKSLHSILELWTVAIGFAWQLVRAGLVRAFTGWIQGDAAIRTVMMLAGCAVLALSVLERRGRWTVALALIGIAGAYGIIAIGRAPMVYLLGAASKRTIAQSAELPRYHYFSTAVFFLAAVRASDWLERRWRGSGRVVVAAWSVMQLAAWTAHATPPNPHLSAGIAVERTRNALANFKARAPVGTTVYVGNASLPPSVTVGTPPTDIPAWAAIYAITDKGNDGPRVRFIEPLRRVRDAFVAPTSHRLSQLMLAPWTPRGAPRDCGVAIAREIGSLLSDLLRCSTASEKEDLCRKRAERRYERRSHSMPQCHRNPGVADLVRRHAQIGRRILACNGSDVPRPETTACTDRRRRRFVALVRTLSACHVAGLRQFGRPDNPVCTEGALRQWMRGGPQDGGSCPRCAEDALIGDLTAKTVIRLMDRAVPMPVAAGEAIYLPKSDEPG